MIFSLRIIFKFYSEKALVSLTYSTHFGINLLEQNYLFMGKKKKKKNSVNLISLKSLHSWLLKRK